METGRIWFPEDPLRLERLLAQVGTNLDEDSGETGLDESELDDEEPDEGDDWDGDDIESELDLDDDEDDEDEERWGRWNDDDPADKKRHRTPGWD